MRLWRALVAIVMVSAAGGRTQAEVFSDPAPRSFLAQVGSHEALAPFHRALDDLQAGRRQRVVVLQVGDSHTVADHFTQRLRELLQSRFGNAGRGHLPVAYGYPQYKPYGVRIKKVGNWILLNARRDDDPGPYGLSGYRLIGNDAGDSIELEADVQFDTAEIEVLVQPAGGTLMLRVDGAPAGEISTAAPTRQMRRFMVPLRGPGQVLTLSPRGDGAVELLAWGVWQSAPGLALISHGVSGAAVGIMERFDPSIVAAEVATLDPALVILAFGTNEGFSLSFDAAAYRGQFAARLAEWRRLAPSAAIVVVGPPNALRVPDYCGAKSAQRDRLGCSASPAKSSAEYYRLMVQHSRLLCRWHEPTPETEARAIQRAEAARQGAHFWDWGQVPAGPCGMDAWVRRDPPLVHKDRVHMMPEGYALGAEALHRDLMLGYRSR